ncbi:cytochrome c oxidase assembly protein [Marinospirillum alkaliphilum]|uniref:Cytochrome c oxidase assembly protein CtaG n=1 Tax=Marinospirillum alkaliphilum DSM 21637 TaxID=1122209 RepID=A0A1K1VZA5_9GAMM|nr:cytochrome c oxidase assembly protein [Marinospirillum alkaliphilum]SFX30502.1 cytochrome c oxidase assembly protein subunit 11 [Marinospirillum alkaliphilum DSM 21637]
MSRDQQLQQQNVARTVRRVLLGLVLMVGFTIALVPLYDVFCEVTGLNGKTASSAQVVGGAPVDTGRRVEVQFVTRNAPGLPWRLDAMEQTVWVHPGEVALARFAFVNVGQELSSGRAVPSVSPSQGARYFRKMECFCFQEQWLEAGERSEMPLVFQIDPDLPEGVNKLTLAYTLYPQGQAIGGYHEQ